MIAAPDLGQARFINEWHAGGKGGGQSKMYYTLEWVAHTSIPVYSKRRYPLQEAETV
jgi:hypothetical protein